MALHHSTIQRLAFVKYVFTKGLEQSNLPEPFSAVSILMFHDAVEIFLQVSSEHLNAGKRQPDFMDYWEFLKPKLAHEMPQQESMRRLNKARVGLKHSGTLPSAFDLGTFKVYATQFFEEATPLVFGISFESISLIEYVDPAESRELLRRAEKELQESKLHDALVLQRYKRLQ